MSQEQLEKDLKEVLKKHGLKADGDDKNGDDDDEEEKEPESKPAESNNEDNKANNSKVVADLADSITSKLIDAVAKKKSFSDRDEDSYGEHIRSKILTPGGEMKEISYPSNLDGLNKEEKILTFFKALIYSSADAASAQVLRALVEGTDAQGGFLVPEELRAEIFRILPDFAVMRRIARTIPMASQTLLLNSLTARPTAFWTSEYASKSTTSAEFSQTTLTANDLVALLPVTDQLIADANIGVVQFIIEIFAEVIGRTEDKAFFTGSGSGRPRGINQESLTTVAAGGTIDFDNVIELIDSVPQRITQSGSSAFVAHRRVKRLLRIIKDGNNNFIWRDGGAVTAPGTDGQTRRLPDTLYGYPFHEQNDLAGSELYFGDWRFYIIGDRQAISVRTTQEGGTAWRRNATEIKAVERVDGRAVLTGAFAKITGA